MFKSFTKATETTLAIGLLFVATSTQAFGKGGKTQTTFNLNVIPSDAVLQADGKIVVATGFDNTSIATEAFGLVRYNSNGSLDKGFGTNGKVFTSFTNFINSPAALALQSDGKLVLVGNASRLVCGPLRSVSLTSESAGLKS